HAVDLRDRLGLRNVVGIVLSLVFLGYELKRSNDIAEAEAVAQIYSMTNEMSLVMAEDPALSQVFRRAQSDFKSLDADEQFRFLILLESVVNSSEAAWKYYDKGIISRAETDSYTRGLCRLLGLDESLAEMWRSDAHNRLPGYYHYATDVCRL
ncbi:MAG: hypothetical protein AAFX10_09295, partial [Pseudomonadota bacterium]